MRGVESINEGIENIKLIIMLHPCKKSVRGVRIYVCVYACVCVRVCAYACVCVCVRVWWWRRLRSRAVVARWVELETALSLLDFACDGADEL